MTAHQSFLYESLNDFQRAMLDGMGPIERAAFDAQPEAEKIAVLAMHTGKGFTSRRMPPSLNITYAYLMRDVSTAIHREQEQDYEKPTFDSALDRHRASQMRGRVNPIEIRQRIQAMLLDMQITAKMRTSSGIELCISPATFGDGSDEIFDRMERGEPITALVVPQSLWNETSAPALVRLDEIDGHADEIQTTFDGFISMTRDLDLQEIHREETGVVFFDEDEYQRARKPTHAIAAGTASSAAIGQANAVVAVAAEMTREPQAKRGPGRPDDWDHDEICGLGHRALKGEFGPVPPSLRNLALVVAQQYSDLRGQVPEDVVETFRRDLSLSKMLKEHQKRLVGNN